MPEAAARRCRFCSAPLCHTFVDLGMSPLCESYVAPEALHGMEPFYPLHAFVCEACFLVQLEEFVSGREIFSDYAYFSSYSDSWLRQARAYTEAMQRRFGLGPRDLVVEVASNDGYLLQYFVEKGIPVLGIEPAANVAKVAVEKGIPTLVRYFGEDAARALLAEGRVADLLVANNVFAHVPDLNDFTRGLALLLKRDGVLTIEVQHLEKLVAGNQFDTIYHEHFQYYSFTTAERVLRAHGLVVFDVEDLPTHGGSMRIFAKHAESGAHRVEGRVEALRAREAASGVADLAYYNAFAEKVRETKRRLLEFLIGAKRSGKTIVGYGAPGKGNTLLNYCGIRTDFLDYTVDRSPYKQGRFLPGTHIPIFHPDRIRETKPDFVMILPWNLRDEIIEQLSYIREWGGKFAVPIPEVTVIP